MPCALEVNATTPSRSAADEGPHVLVVDDSAVAAALLRFNLEQVGLRVSVARHGRRAWELAQRHHYDLVITDHQMPWITGVELCRRLRQQPAYRSTPFILLTAKAWEINVDQATNELNLAAVLVKPFSPHQLRATVRYVLAIAQSRTGVG